MRSDGCRPEYGLPKGRVVSWLHAGGVDLAAGQRQEQPLRELRHDLGGCGIRGVSWGEVRRHAYRTHAQCQQGDVHLVEYPAWRAGVLRASSWVAQDD